MMSMFCVISATAMSRKGSEYIYMKCIPMSYHDQIRAMLVSGILISLLGTLPYALVFNIIAVVFRSAPGDPSLHHGDHGFIYPVRKL